MRAAHSHGICGLSTPAAIRASSRDPQHLARSSASIASAQWGFEIVIERAFGEAQRIWLAFEHFVGELLGVGVEAVFRSYRGDEASA